MTKSDRLSPKKKAMIEAMKSQLGVVSAACKKANVSRDTHYRWMKESPKYKQAIEESELVLKDFGENALFKLMKAGNPQAIIFFNKTRNKDRGYVEKKELDISAKVDIRKSELEEAYNEVFNGEEGDIEENPSE